MSAIVCPLCGKSDGLVVQGLVVAAMLGRYQSECTWALTCFECSPGTTVLCINDDTRDEMFGTGWRSK